MTPFLAPAPEGPFVSTSPHFLPSRASRSQRLALAVLVLVRASSVRFQLSAGRCRAVFAFPVRREDSVHFDEQKSMENVHQKQQKFSYNKK